MGMFKDNSGQTWLCPINILAVERVKEATGVNLCDVVLGPLHDRLVTDDQLLARILYALCEPERKARGLSDEDFFNAIQGDPLEDAHKQVMEGLLGNFLRPRSRQRLRDILSLQEIMDKNGSEAIKRHIERVQQEIKLLNSATDSPESSESTPDT